MSGTDKRLVLNEVRTIIENYHMVIFHQVIFPIIE